MCVQDHRKYRDLLFLFETSPTKNNMIGAGYSRECLQVYANVRKSKSAMETIFKQLGIVQLGIGDIQRLDWEVVEVKIRITQINKHLSIRHNTFSLSLISAFIRCSMHIKTLII